MENVNTEIRLIELAHEDMLNHTGALSYWLELGYSWSDYCRALDHYLGRYFG